MWIWFFFMLMTLTVGDCSTLRKDVSLSCQLQLFPGLPALIAVFYLCALALVCLTVICSFFFTALDLFSVLLWEDTFCEFAVSLRRCAVCVRRWCLPSRSISNWFLPVRFSWAQLHLHTYRKNGVFLDNVGRTEIWPKTAQRSKNNFLDLRLTTFGGVCQFGGVCRPFFWKTKPKASRSKIPSEKDSWKIAGYVTFSFSPISFVIVFLDFLLHNCGCLMASGVGVVGHFWLFRAT